MPPSHKRQTTPPDASPAKRPTTGLPDIAPEPNPASVPTALELKPKADEWLDGFFDRLRLLMDPLVGSKDTPLPASHTLLLEQADISDFVMKSARGSLIRCVNDIDEYLAEDQSFVPTPCPRSCPLLHPPTMADKAVTTDAPAEPAPAEPIPLSPVPRSYASMAVGSPATPGPKTTVSKPPDPKPSQTSCPKPKTPGQAPSGPAPTPIRLIVRPGPSAPASSAPFAPLFIRGPTEPYRRLSHALSLNTATKNVKLLGVHQNRSKNLVVLLAPGTLGTDVANVIPIARSTLAPFGDLSPPVIDRDVRWTKLLVSSVPARTEPSAPIHPEADVHASFLLNPSVSALKITRPPRWIRNPASITGAHSSFTFSFEDPDGSLARQLAKSPLFIFGVPVHLKRWVDKPLAMRKETRKQSRSSD